MSRDDITLGAYIRDLRTAGDVSLRELARKINCSPAFLSDVELDRRSPTDEMFGKIASALGVTVEELKKNDTRPPVEDVRRRTQADPSYAYALRKVLDSGASSEELLGLVKKIEDGRGRK